MRIPSGHLTVRARRRALLAVMLVAFGASGCGSLNFLTRRGDGVINVQGEVLGLPSDAPCDLKLLTSNGRTVGSLRISPVFDKSVVVAPAGAKRRFEISCAGYAGSFRSRAYKSRDFAQVDLGTIMLSAQGDTQFSRR